MSSVLGWVAGWYGSEGGTQRLRFRNGTTPPAYFHNGIPFERDGVVATFSGSPNTFSNGLPFFDGRLCIRGAAIDWYTTGGGGVSAGIRMGASTNPVDHYNGAVPLVAGGQLAQDQVPFWTIDFDGLTQAGTTTAWEPTTSRLTIEVEVTPDTIPSGADQWIVAGTAATGVSVLRILDTGVLDYLARDDLSGAHTLRGGTLVAGTTYKIKIEQYVDRCELWLDDAMVDSEAFTTSPVSFTVVGANTGASALYYAGSIGYIAWDDPAERTNSRFYPIDEGTGTVLADANGGPQIDLIGNPSWVSA